MAETTIDFVDNFQLIPFTPPGHTEYGVSQRGDAVYERNAFEIFWQYLNGGNYEYLYESCPALASVIMKKATAFSNGLFETINPRSGNYVRGAYKEWDRLWEQPNAIQSRSQFATQLAMFLGIRGWCYALPVYAVGFEDSAPSAIWLLPPHCINVELRTDKPFYNISRGENIRRVFFTVNGVRREIDESKLILFTDSASIISTDTLLPQGRIWSLRKSIQNLIGAMTSRGTLIHNRGAQGILSQDRGDAAGPMPVKESDKLDLQRKLDRYGLMPDQWSIIATTASLKYQPIGFDVKQLGLHEEHLSDVKDIYEGFGVPFPLSAHSDQSTYNNVESAMRGLYQDTVIPEANGIMEQFNRGLKAEEKGVRFIVSYDHISYLQQSQKDKGEGMKAVNDALLIEWENGLITRNMWLEAIGRDTVKNPIFDKYKYELTPEELGVVNMQSNGEDPNAAGGQGEAESEQAGEAARA